MKLLFEEITGKAHHYTISDRCWLPKENRDVLPLATAHITVSRYDREFVLLKGELKGQRVALCDRCGEQVTESIHSTFSYRVTTREEIILGSDIECSDDDFTTLYLKEPEIDVDEILREQSYLAVPFKTLCSEECKGICAGCGAVLNNENCSCSCDSTRSPFAVLKELTSKKN